MKEMKKLWIGLAIFAILSPLGLLASGDAWGEWGSEAFKNMVGFVPKGLVKFSTIWNAPLPDYSLPQAGDILGYVISAFVGILLVVVATWLLGKGLAHRDGENTQS